MLENLSFVWYFLKWKNRLTQASGQGNMIRVIQDERQCINVFFTKVFSKVIQLKRSLSGSHRKSVLRFELVVHIDAGPVVRLHLPAGLDTPAAETLL